MRSASLLKLPSIEERGQTDRATMLTRATPMRTTHSCICTSVATKWRHPPISSAASIDIGHWTSANRLKLNANKTELLFASSGHCCAALKGSYPVLKLGADTAVASSHVRLLGVDISLDLSVDRHVSRVCVGCFYRLRQLWRIRRSLDSDSLVTLIYAVVNSRIDYCNTVLAGAPRTVTDKLQRVLNVAARVITCTRKFDRGLGQILHDQLH